MKQRPDRPVPIQRKEAKLISACKSDETGHFRSYAGGDGAHIIYHGQNLCEENVTNNVEKPFDCLFLERRGQSNMRRICEK